MKALCLLVGSLVPLVPLSGGAAVVELGAAGNFMFFQSTLSPAGDSSLGSGTYNGDFGVSETNSNKFDIASKTVNGTIFTNTGSTICFASDGSGKVGEKG